MKLNYFLLFLFALIILNSCKTSLPSNSTVSYFSEEELKLIYENDSSQAMRVWKINNKEDSIFLRKNCQEVAFNPTDTTIHYFVHRLFKTVRNPNSLGVGIAAPQVGINKRIIWVKRFDKIEEEMPFEVYINPKIIKYSTEVKETAEGCLSIPDRREKVIRPDKITIEYQSLDGKVHQEIVDGFTSVIFQHEIDHLDGILFLDHLKNE
ncbi:peptide deformylase [Bernardetia litoralis DSM 6794]|uniref:Peptide deformylase n=1 Tax=Bernardetia litoralis (strain ATCC 23117 / DSM 6794 / NBRC 15988 / NCIMB 1366 / Fx l1 / Sio-4) TaxID=880071 RepID=I4ALR9_BERLS|nr:peptide deformylase [Bernardetia litoralis]AFM04904.1 peptide deformylase [Bernardetia litoralis DSM 6794]